MSDLLDEDGALQNRAIATIRPLIPADAEDRVARTVRQFNAIIREHIRSETGLKLSDDNAKSAVGVHVIDGFPVVVARLIDRFPDLLLWRLIMLQPKLGGVVEGLSALLEPQKCAKRLFFDLVSEEKGEALICKFEIFQAVAVFRACARRRGIPVGNDSRAAA
jgi:hypothetical protein